MWELDHKEGWAPKNWCFRTAVLEKTLESPLDSKEIKPVNPKGNQSWILIGRTDAEAPILWPSHEKSWFIGKDPDPGKDGGQVEKGVTKDEMAEWHHWLKGHEFEQALGEVKDRDAWCAPNRKDTMLRGQGKSEKKDLWGHHSGFPAIWWLAQEIWTARHRILE